MANMTYPNQTSEILKKHDITRVFLFHTGVTTIAGGKRGHLGGHVDGAGEDAKFSNDFDVVYAASSCSLLVVDRGNLAIREIQLHHHDCTSYRQQQDENDEDDDDVSFPLGMITRGHTSLISSSFQDKCLKDMQLRIIPLQE